MGVAMQWSSSTFVVFFLWGAFIREAHPAIASYGEHKGSQRRLLMEEDHSNSNHSELGSK